MEFRSHEGPYAGRLTDSNPVFGLGEGFLDVLVGLDRLATSVGGLLMIGVGPERVLRRATRNGDFRRGVVGEMLVCTIGEHGC